MLGGAGLFVGGPFSVSGYGGFQVLGGSTFAVADPSLATLQTNFVEIGGASSVTVASIDSIGAVHLGRSGAGAELHVLGDVQNRHSLNANTAVWLQNGALLEVEGSYFFEGQPSFVNNIDIQSGSTLDVAGELRIENAARLQIAGGSNISVGGPFSMTGYGIFQVKDGSTFTVADPSLATVQTNFLEVGGASAITLATVDASGSIRVGTTGAGSELHVLGNVVNHHAFPRQNLLLSNGAILEVDGDYTLHGSSDKTTEVTIQAESQVVIGGAFSAVDLERFDVLAGSSFSVNGPFSMRGYGIFQVMSGSTFSVADPSLATLQTNFVGIGGASSVTVASIDSIGAVHLGRSGAGAELHVLGDVQNRHSLNANTAVWLQNGALLEVGGSYFFEGQPPFINNIDILSGSTLDVAGELRVKDAARLQVATGATATAAILTFDGTTTLVGGGVLQSDAATILPAARLRGSLANFLTTGVLSNQGALSPGAGIGVFTVQGGYEQTAAGSLEAEVGENQSGLIADRLMVTGSASIAGRIDLLLAEGFSPADGDEWTLFEATEITGQIDGVTFPRPEQIPADLAVEIVSTATTIGVRFIDQTVGGNIVSAATELDWSEAANWTGASVPSAGSAVTLTGAAGVAQTLSVAPSSRVRVADLDLSGNGEELKLVVGANAGFGSLRGIRLGDNGALDVAGGRVVTGALAIAEGGSVKVQNGGVLTVRSQASKSLSVDSLVSGDASELQVSGSGSTVQAFSSVVVGDLGDGSLLINSGGALGANLAGTDAANALSIGIGATGNGDVEVNGAGSLLSVGGQMLVGGAGAGSMAVTQGGRLTTVGAAIGVTPGSIGSVEVRDIGSTWRNEGSISLGGAPGIAGGAATLRVASGARVETTERLHLNDGATLDLSDGAGAAVIGTAARGVSPLPIAPGRLTVEPTGDLTGSGTVDGSVFSAGRVAPGNSPGILTITGDYTQTPTSVLEIEVGALTPGPGSPNIDAGHDQIRVGGVATLGGRYDFPIINGFVPQVNDEIVFLDTFDADGAGPLPRGSIAAGTRPSSAFAPGLFEANPNLAFRVIASPTDVRLRFVPKGSVTFTDPNNATADWFVATGWNTGTVPTNEDETLVQGNLTGQTQVVNVGAASTAQVQQLRVRDDFSPVTVRVASGASLESTVGNVNVGARGTIELSGGEIVTPTTQAVSLYESGMLTGSGTIDSSLQVGVTAGSSSAMLSPGLSAAGSLVGSVTIAGGYTHGAGGVLDIDITGNNSGANHDFVDVAGDLVIGTTDAMGVVTPGTVGKLQVDLSAVANPASLIGQEYVIAEAASIDGRFAEVEVMGAGNVWFRVQYPDSAPAAATEGEVANLALSQELTGTILPKGKIIGEGPIDANDAAVFSAVLISGVGRLDVNIPGGIFSTETQEIRGAFDFVNVSLGGSERREVDFNDVPYFAAAMAQSQGISYAQAMSTFERVYAEVYLASVPEPATPLMALMAAGGMAGVRWRRRA